MIVKMVDVLDAAGNVIATNRANALRDTPVISPYNIYDAYKGIARTNRSVLNTDEFEFNERFSDILSEAIMLDNRYLLSPEQKKLIDRYFAKAPDSVGSVTEDSVYNVLADNDLVQLDKYLGGI